MEYKKVCELACRYADEDMERACLETFRELRAACPPAKQLELTCRFLTIVRQRAVRFHAPAELRFRILAKLPHRQGTAH